MDYHVLCAGDVIVDAFISIKHADEHCHTSEKEKEICFTAGAKIPVDDCQFRLGGNASNVSVGLSRLGFKTALIAETGDDEFAQKIVKGLREEKVSLEFMKQTQNAPATFAINLTFMHDRTILSRHVKRKHDLDFENATTSWVYLTSIGEEWKPLYHKVLTFVKTRNTMLAFNPGSKQLQDGVRNFSDILQLVEILFVNKEEAEEIVFGREKKESKDELLYALQKLGPKIVSITDGERGSYAVDKNGRIYTQEMIPSVFKQKTGVGDAYASGFLASLFYNQGDMQQALLWGATNASSVVEHIGAQPGLLTKEELLRRVKIE